jgi:hypothetical protein
VPGQEGPGLRPDFRIPRRDQSWRTAEAPGGLPLSYEGYIITAPRSLAESTAFQNLMKKGMLFRAPEAGPGEYHGPHFRFTPEGPFRTGRELTGGEAGPQVGRKWLKRDTGIRKKD